MYNTTTRPKVIEKQLKGPFPFIVIFTNNSCEECKELIPKFQGIAEKIKGWAALSQINCELNSSVKFCKEQRITKFPTIKMFNQADEEPMPIMWDMDDEITDKAFISWIYNYRKPIMSKSPLAEAFMNFIDENENTTMLVFLTRAEYPQTFMNKVTVEMSGNFQNIIHQPTFDDDAYATYQTIPGGEELVPNKNNVAIYQNKRFAVYKGPMKYEDVM